MPRDHSKVARRVSEVYREPCYVGSRSALSASGYRGKHGMTAEGIGIYLADASGFPVPRDRSKVARRVSEVLREPCYSGSRSAVQASGYRGKHGMTAEGIGIYLANASGFPLQRGQNTVARRVSEVLRESCYSGSRSAVQASGYHGKHGMTVEGIGIYLADASGFPVPRDRSKVARRVSEV